MSNVSAMTPAATANPSAVDLASPPPGTGSVLWNLSSPTEREALLAQVPNPQPGPAPLTRAERSGLPLGSLQTGAIDGFWVGESGNGVRRAYDPGVTPLGQVPAIRPDAGFARSGGSVIFVNGLNNNEAQAANAGQLIANKTGSDVRVFFNATQGANDIPRAVGDNLNAIGVSRTPAANALASTIATSAAAGQDLHIISTSHGSILARNSLIIAREQLLSQYGYRDIALPGLRAEVDPAGYQRQLSVNANAERRTFEALHHIKFETLGSGTATFPVAGPRYLHWVNTNDPVTWATGIDFQGVAPRLESIQPGFNAVVARFTSGAQGAVASHFLETYLPTRNATGNFDRVYNANASGNGNVSIVDIGKVRLNE